MSSDPAVVGTCLFWRALFLLLEGKLITVDLVAKRLGIDTTSAKAIIVKLGGEGCLEDHEVEGQYKVLKEVLKKKTIPKFIGRKGKESNVVEGLVNKGGSQDGGMCGKESNVVEGLVNKGGSQDG